MAAGLPVARRSYPHVDGVGDWQAAASIKLLWDRVWDQENRLTLANSTMTAQAAAITAQAATIDDLEIQINRLSISSPGAGAGSPTDNLDTVDTATVGGPFPNGPTAISFPGLGTVQVYSSPNVSGWAQTSTLTHWGFDPGAIVLNHTKLGQWPPVTIAKNTTQEATIWLFANTGSGWIGAGAERLRPSQSTKPEPTNYSEWFINLFYDASRWGPLSSLTPFVGMPTAVLITAGSTRVDNRYFVQERTDILQFSWPADGQSVTFL